MAGLFVYQDIEEIALQRVVNPKLPLFSLVKWKMSV